MGLQAWRRQGCCRLVHFVPTLEERAVSGAVGRRRLVVSTMERRGCTGLPALSCARECPMRDLLLDTAELSLGNVVVMSTKSGLHEYSLQSLAVSLTIDQMREQAS